MKKKEASTTSGFVGIIAMLRTLASPRDNAGPWGQREEFSNTSFCLEDPPDG